MNSVADVLHPQFTRSWHEAVAIVLEVASHLSPGQPPPGPQDLLLAADGTLTILFASEAPAHPVSGCGELLVRLLEGIEAPAPLRDLATENASATPAHTSLEGFTRALQYYERPDRKNDLLAVAGRLARFAPREPEAELELLRQKLANGPEKPAAEPPSRQSARRRVVVVAAVIVALAAFASVAFSSRKAARRTLPSAVAHAINAINKVEAKLSDAFSTRVNPQGAVSAEAPAPPREVSAKPQPIRAAVRNRSTPALRRPGGRVPAPVSRVSRGAPAREATGGPPAAPMWTGVEALAAAVTAPAPVGVPEPGSLPVPPAAVPTAADERVYTRADAAVRAPVFLRPQLPTQPAPTPLTSYYEILVNEQGTVEAVKIVSPKRRYYDAMLAAAAKAWMFKPAVRDGRPVKYSIRVPIIVPESLQ